MKTAILTLAFLAGPAAAQMMVEAVYQGQVLTSTKAGKVTACGIRIVATPMAPSKNHFRLIDTSMNVTDAGWAMGKIIVSEGSLPIYCQDQNGSKTGLRHMDEAQGR